MKLGIDRFLTNKALQKQLTNQRIALLAHPASMTSLEFIHSIDALAQLKTLKLSAAFGPQHGMKGEKQDNMIESDDYIDPQLKIPVFSLYGQVRRPTPKMLENFDVLLVDLQDLGCRIYTFLTTMLYMLEACAQASKKVIILDRPNPAGRPVEGLALKPGWQSFVGAAEQIPMRHGLTLGEAAQWFKQTLKLNLDLEIVKMDDYNPLPGPGYGWPLEELSWVNPSPNASNLSMARCYAGTVLLEGTTLSEGRGTTRPLEVIGAPDLDFSAILKQAQRLEPKWLAGAKIRPCFFEPTFHKHQKKLNSGLQIHVDDQAYQHDLFKPFRLVALLLKALRLLHPSYDLYRKFDYEYESTRLAFDVINGSPLLREWIDDPQALPGDLEKFLVADEKNWLEQVQTIMLYPA